MNKKDILTTLIDHYAGGNKARFAQIIGITPQNLSRWVSRETYDAEKLTNCLPNINPSYLLTGKGSVTISDNSNTITQNNIIGDNHCGQDNISELIKALNIQQELTKKALEENQSLINIITNLTQICHGKL